MRTRRVRESLHGAPIRWVARWQRGHRPRSSSTSAFRYRTPTRDGEEVVSEYRLKPPEAGRAIGGCSGDRAPWPPRLLGGTEEPTWGQLRRIFDPLLRPKVESIDDSVLSEPPARVKAETSAMYTASPCHQTRYESYYGCMQSKRRSTE